MPFGEVLVFGAFSLAAAADACGLSDGGCAAGASPPSFMEHRPLRLVGAEEDYSSPTCSLHARC